MTEDEALTRMISPGMKRVGKWRNGVIQIWVTRACDKACFGCTQGSNFGGKPGMITTDQFEQACRSLSSAAGNPGYWGVIGMFGGNPTMHPQFDKLCAIMRTWIPFEQRGLWSNKLLGKGSFARATFNPRVSNLNVHLDQEAYDEFKRDWPEALPVGLAGDSRHSPPYIALQDIIPSESERWDLISNCDINQHWSAMIGVFRGQLRAYFCEIAGAQAMLHQHEEDYPDYGLPVEPGWWQKSMNDFREQARFHCHACGVPLRGYGELAQGSTGKEQVSMTHAKVAIPKTKNRKLEIVENQNQLGVKKVGRVIDYIQNAN